MCNLNSVKFRRISEGIKIHNHKDQGTQKLSEHVEEPKLNFTISIQNTTCGRKPT